MTAGRDTGEAATAQAAAEWVTRRDRGLTAREAAELAAWEQADPRHAAALAAAGGAWHGLDRLRGVSELEAMADVVVGRARARQRHRRVRRFSTFALGLAAALVLGVAGWLRLEPEPADARAPLAVSIQVLASTLRSQILPDGSVAELNGDSRIEYDYTGTERRVRLVSGEAHFVVAKYPDRPFLVSAGPVTVRAVGTAFNVRLATTGIEVLVTEGTVQVAAADPAVAVDAMPGHVPALVAGQRALFDPAAETTAHWEVGDVGRVEIEEALGWQGTRLVFSGTALDEVVTAFNRYNRHQLTLGEPKLSERKLTGTFRADNLEGFLRLVRQMIDVKAELRTPTETVLLSAR